MPYMVIGEHSGGNDLSVCPLKSRRTDVAVQLVDAPTYGTATNGPTDDTLWNPAVLNSAVMELRRESPRLPAERIVQAVNVAAQGIEPKAGRRFDAVCKDAPAQIEEGHGFAPF